MTRNKIQILLILTIVLIDSCVEQFIPVIQEEKELLVVQGLITDQAGSDTIKLSKSLPLGQKSSARPVSGCDVSISDNLNNSFSLLEIQAGTYITPSGFRGVPGQTYTLHIKANSDFNNFSYESQPVQMLPVPPIDSLYYVKTTIRKPDGYFRGVDGCQIYLDTFDPAKSCRYFRWEFFETWELRLQYPVQNQTCWIYDKSKAVNIKSTVAFNEDRISRYPINYISNASDRLKRKYSILVNQYSMNEAEYVYWEKIQNIAIQVGGLYDVIPASVENNLTCIESPSEKVLGYFSVSAKSSKRIFIKDNFEGIIDQYSDCISDTIPHNTNPPGLGESVWILIDFQYYIPPFTVLTKNRGCVDCTVRGSNLKPDFWTDDK